MVYFLSNMDCPNLTSSFFLLEWDLHLYMNLLMEILSSFVHLDSRIFSFWLFLPPSFIDLFIKNK